MSMGERMGVPESRWVCVDSSGVSFSHEYVYYLHVSCISVLLSVCFHMYLLGCLSRDAMRLYISMYERMVVCTCVSWVSRLCRTVCV